MKKIVVVFTGLLGLVSIAQADVSVQGLEMQTFLRCNPTHIIPDAGISIELQQARIGGYKQAIVTTTSIAGARSEIYAHVTSRPEIVEGDEAIGTIYKASKGRKQLELTVDYSRRDDNTLPGVLDVNGFKSDVSCQSFLVLM